ncbi:NPR2 family protein [Heterostelium album PN500]|uniref:NPR2 family protein n=1 Tax=Heterostelium pallidum (strain ATCC 26659 / Pp 5 / PN500) TaxID=670386 RepID=D3BHR5_HETP5|nr:NPR2 family protein [Heterostelium album PN500]EFA78815.1 NPR2 family protein [Heterostelium album PN500]|eukprot:XP_020430939.1 NPR2 family protein [Heterostelium album PN500]
MEGPIKCIFYSEFHNIYGTKIFYQYPEGFIANDVFEGFAEFIIPKPKLCGKVITLTAFDYKILGYPVLLQDVKYHRNALLFNLAMVFDKHTDTTIYHNIIRKLGTILRTLETETEYLFNQSKVRDQPDLLKILETLYIELNSYGESTITVDDANTINVKLFNKPPEPIEILDHQVPVLIEEIDTSNASEWDLTLLQILPYIDGVNYVSRISKLTEIDINLVKSCIKHLVYYSIVKMVDIFQYSNIYNPTPLIRKLASNLDMQSECSAFITTPGSTICSFETIFMLYANMSTDTPFREYCTENELTSLGIDERSFIIFGVINGFLRRKQRYPILNNLKLLEKLPQNDKKRLLNGNKSFDEICCILSVGMDVVEKLLSEIAEPDQYTVIWK